MAPGRVRTLSEPLNPPPRDDVFDIGYAGALLGGVATLVSPCSALLLPAFFAYAFTGSGRQVARTGVFYLGLITTLVPMGAAAASLGALFTEHRGGFILIASVLIIVLGCLQCLGVSIPIPRLGAVRTKDATTVASVYLMGTVYGIAGACSGPILGSVLAIAAIGANPLRGGLLLAVFALGMVIPLLVLAMVWQALEPGRWLRPRPIALGPVRTTVWNLVAGLGCIVIGAAMAVTEGLSTLGGPVSTDQQLALESWLLRASTKISDLVVIVGIVVMIAAALVVARRSRTATRD